MALRDMIIKETDERNRVDYEDQVFIAQLPSYIEKGILDQANNLYNEICKKIATDVALNQSMVKGYLEVPQCFKIDVPYRPIKIPDRLVSEYMLEAYEPHDGFAGGFQIPLCRIETVDCFFFRACRLQYYNRNVWSKIYAEISKLCNQDGIQLESICMAEIHRKGYKKHSIDSTYRVKWHDNIGGGSPVYRSYVILPFTYVHR